MLLTRIWSVILAVLAVGCLAGMFLLSAESNGDFTEADRAAIRAVTEAGVAALEAEIEASPVRQVGGVLGDPRLLDALERPHDTPVEELPADALPLDQILAEVAENLRVRTNSNITLAVIESTGAIVAVNGIAEPNIAQLVASDAYKAVPPTEEALFSITLGSELHVANVTAAQAGDKRLAAVDKLRIGAGSLLRRVLGSNTPAGMVRKGALVGDIIGNQPVSSEIELLAREHGEDVSDRGASKVFVVGEGLDARIGALGRVPGPAGSGRSGAMLAVLSSRTAAAGKEDLAESLGDAREKGLLGRVNWGLLVGLFVVSAGLAIYLPTLEATGPMRRLTREFQALSQGAQHQIFHDRYSGAPRELARTAGGAVDALRQAFLAELEIEDDVDDAEASKRPRSSRHRRLTRAHQKLGEKQTTGASGRLERRGSRAHPAVDPPREEPAPATVEPIPQQQQREEAEPKPATNDEPQRGLPAAPPAHTPTASGGPARAPSFGPPTAVPPRPPPAGGTQLPPAPTRHPTPVANTVPRPPSGSGASPQPVSPQPTPISAHEPADPKEAAYREIYDEFIQVKAACGEPTDNLTFERFAAKLRKNERDLRKKRQGIKDVSFTVYVKDGKAALKAKVIK